VKAVRLYEYGGPENLKYEDNVCRAPDRTFQSTGFTLVAELSTSTESSLNAGDYLGHYFPRRDLSCKRRSALRIRGSQIPGMSAIVMRGLSTEESG
jgi:hypothetical protein